MNRLNIIIDSTAPMPSDQELYAAIARCNARETVELRLPSRLAYDAIAKRLPQIANRVRHLFS